jgi:hypothetical protein
MAAHKAGLMLFCRSSLQIHVRMMYSLKINLSCRAARRSRNLNFSTDESLALIYCRNIQPQNKKASQAWRTIGYQGISLQPVCLMYESLPQKLSELLPARIFSCLSACKKLREGVGQFPYTYAARVCYGTYTHFLSNHFRSRVRLQGLNYF